MWIFLSDAFLSVVADRDNADRLMVRSRVRGDIERAFAAAGVPVPDDGVAETPNADYRFRVFVDRAAFASLVLPELVRSIDYPNFKGSVRDDRRHDAYMDAWSVMHRFQRLSLAAEAGL